jgi:hypothetical protein
VVELSESLVVVELSESLVVVEPDESLVVVELPPWAWALPWLDAGVEAGGPGFVGTWVFPEEAIPWLVGEEGRPALDEEVPVTEDDAVPVPVLEAEAVPPPVAAIPSQKAVIVSPLAFAAAARLANATELLARELTAPVAAVAAAPACCAA